MEFVPTKAEKQWEGHGVEAWLETFAYADGTTVDRTVIRRPAVVAILPFDGEKVYFVRQPREAVGEEALMEIPCGKVDASDADPLSAARRELREEVGYDAKTRQHLRSFYSSTGLASYPDFSRN